MVKAGQWWTDKGSMAVRHRILVRGLTSKGDIVFCESADGRAYTLTLEYFLKFKEHLPECTSFEWVPEVYPQYRETFESEKYAFVRLDSPFEYTYVLKSGTEEVRQNSAFGYAHVSERTKLTEAEAMAKIVKPEPKVEPGEFEMLGLDDVVRFEHGFNYTDNSGPSWSAVGTTPWFRVGWTVRDYHTKEFSTLVFRKSVKPKTRTVKVHTVLYTRPFGGLGATVVSDDSWNEISKNWKNGRILKTEEFEVPCE